MLEYPKQFIKEIPNENLCKETIEMTLSFVSVFCQYYSEIEPEISGEKVGEILDIIWHIMKYSKSAYKNFILFIIIIIIYIE